MYGKRGQVSTEYTIATGVLLVFLVFAVSFSYDRVNETIRTGKLANSLETIDRSVDSIYMLGQGSREIISMDLPKGIESIIINNTIFNVKMTSFGSVADFYLEPPAGSYLFGNLSYSEGMHYISIEMINSTDINISE